MNRPNKEELARRHALLAHCISIQTVLRLRFRSENYSERLMRALKAPK